MSRCGSCRGSLCSCQLSGSSTATVIGMGTSYEPFQVRPVSPTYRPVGNAYRVATHAVTLNTDTVITFTNSNLPFDAQADMWNPVQPTRLTAPIAGLYMIGGYASQVAAGAAQIWAIWIAKNSAPTVPLVKRTVTSQGGGDNIQNSVMTLVRLSASDYIELYVRSNRTALTAFTAGGANPGLGIHTNPSLFANWMGE